MPSSAPEKSWQCAGRESGAVASDSAVADPAPETTPAPESVADSATSPARPDYSPIYPNHFHRPAPVFRQRAIQNLNCAPIAAVDAESGAAVPSAPACAYWRLGSNASRVASPI